MAPPTLKTPVSRWKSKTLLHSTPRTSKQRKTNMGVAYKLYLHISPFSSMNKSSSSNDFQSEITKVNTNTINDTWFTDDVHKAKCRDFHSRDICYFYFLDIDFFNEQHFLCFDLLKYTRFWHIINCGEAQYPLYTLLFLCKLTKYRLKKIIILFISNQKLPFLLHRKASWKFLGILFKKSFKTSERKSNPHF